MTSLVNKGLRSSCAKRFQVHFFRTICLHRIKGPLLKVKSVQNNITQRIQIGVSHLCTHIRRWRRILVRLLRLVLICRQYTCDMAAGTAWDTVPIWEQKWPATLLIPVFTPSMLAKLTQVQLRRHAGGRALWWLKLPAAHVLIRLRTVPGDTGGYLTDTSSAYDNQALLRCYVHKVTFTLYQIAFRVDKVWTATALNWNKSFTHIEHCTGAVDREGLGSPSPNPHSWTFTSVSGDSSPLFLLIHFRYGPDTGSHYTKVWHRILSDMLRSALEICAAQQRSVTEIALKSPFSCVNRSLIQYGFRADAKAIGYSEKIT